MYALLYLTESKIITTVRKNEPNNGSGVAGLVTGVDQDNQNYEFTRGDDCLNNTAYDIDGGNIEGIITGISVDGYVEGEVPTAAAYAAIDDTNPNILIVSSGHADSIDLRFSGLTEGARLMPLDAQTQNILDTYGCYTSNSSEPVETTLPPSRSSTWIKQ